MSSEIFDTGSGTSVATVEETLSMLVSRWPQLASVSGDGGAGVISGRDGRCPVGEAKPSDGRGPPISSSSCCKKGLLAVGCEWLSICVYHMMVMG